MKLEDGKGSGRQAEVDSEHRISVASVSEDRAIISNKIGEAYAFSTQFLDISAATEHRLSFIQNKETSKVLAIDVIEISSNGGSTNFDKPTYVRIYTGASVPDTNESSLDATALNTQSSVRPDTDFLIWDGVGSGMTSVTPGTKIFEQIVFPGKKNVLDIPSKYFLGTTKTLTISLECPEAAKISIDVFTHLVSV